MRVLVTGGAGFIGRSVVERLTNPPSPGSQTPGNLPDPAGGVWEIAGGLRAAHEVRVYDRAVDELDDITDLDRLRDAAAGCSVVIHLAAKVGLGVDLSDLDAYAWHNSYGTAVLLRAAAEAGVRRVVYASSMVVYGEGAYACLDHGPVHPPARPEAALAAGRFEVDCPTCGAELTPGLVPESAPADPRNAYAATKAHGEQLAAVWARETGGSVAALRFHNVYGPGMPRNTPYAGVAALFADRLARGEAPRVFEDGGQRRNFIHVHDVADAVVAAVGADLPPGVTALNIGSPWITTVGAMAEQLAALAGGPAPVITGEYRLGDVRHITADCRAAEDILGWRARTPVADGLVDLWA